MNKRKFIYIVANGCHENFMDATQFELYLNKNNDVRICENYSNADIILVLGCAVSQHMEDETKELINHIQSNKSKDSEIIISGCISKVEPELATNSEKQNSLILEIEKVISTKHNENTVSAHSPYRQKDPDVLQFINKRKQRIFTSKFGYDHANALSKISSSIRLASFKIIHKYKDFLESRIDVYNDNTFCIKISSGCLGNCRYCSIKISRGKVESKTVNCILEDIKQGLDKGYTDFALLGTDIGDYGKDLNTDLLHLLEQILKINAKFKLRLRNVNPRWLIPSLPYFSEFLKSKKITYILSPVQSGSNKILKLMNRGYRIEEYMDCIKEIRKNYPFIFLRTQIMVGFPGETDEDFKDSINLLKQDVFDYADIFRYSNRPNVKASMIYDQVPEAIIMQRYKKLFFKTLIGYPLRKAKALFHLNARIWQMY